MAHTFQVVVDCALPHPLADWWAAALGWEVEPSDEGFIRSMIELGLATEDDTTTHEGVLVWKVGAAIRQPSPPEGSGCQRVLFQAVPEPKVGKNRVHLDLRVGAEHVDAEVERLVAAGATVLHEGQQGPYRWITLADPEGNELCVT